MGEDRCMYTNSCVVANGLAGWLGKQADWKVGDRNVQRRMLMNSLERTQTVKIFVCTYLNAPQKGFSAEEALNNPVDKRHTLWMSTSFRHPVLIHGPVNKTVLSGLERSHEHHNTDFSLPRLIYLANAITKCLICQQQRPAPAPHTPYPHPTTDKTPLPRVISSQLVASWLHWNFSIVERAEKSSSLE